MKQILCTIFAFIFISCSKDDENLREDHQNSSKESEILYVKKTNDIYLNQFMSSNEVTVDMFLGSLWSIKNSKDTFEMQKLDMNFKDFKMKVISNSNLNNNSVGYFNPNYQTVIEYANLFHKESFDANVEFQTGDFFDYNVVKSYLTTSSDSKKILDLIKSDDENYIIKKSSGYLENLLTLNLVLTTQYDEFASYFNKEIIKSLKESGANPSYISTVAYGTHSIMMAESNTTQYKLREIIKKIKNNGMLTLEDNKILDDTSIIFYFRGGDKDCFVRKAEGLKEIQDSWKLFSQLTNIAKRNFDYPIWFKLNSLENFGIVSHLWSYHYLEQVN